MMETGSRFTHILEKGSRKFSTPTFRAGRSVARTVARNAVLRVMTTVNESHQILLEISTCSVFHGCKS